MSKLHKHATNNELTIQASDEQGGRKEGGDGSRQ